MGEKSLKMFVPLANQKVLRGYSQSCAKNRFCALEKSTTRGGQPSPCFVLSTVP